MNITGEFRNLSKQNSHPDVPNVLLQSWEEEVQNQPGSHRKLWVISKGILSSGFCTAGPGGTTGREDGDMYSVSSSLSDCSPGGSFGTGNGLEAGETRYKTFTPNLINTKVPFKIHSPLTASLSEEIIWFSGAHKVKPAQGYDAKGSDNIMHTYITKHPTQKWIY